MKSTLFGLAAAYVKSEAYELPVDNVQLGRPNSTPSIEIESVRCRDPPRVNVLTMLAALATVERADHKITRIDELLPGT